MFSLKLPSFSLASIRKASGGPRARWLAPGLEQDPAGSAVGDSHHLIVGHRHRRLLRLDETVARRLVETAGPARLPTAVRSDPAASSDRGLGRRHASAGQRSATGGSIRRATAAVTKL